jgi:hypothetical protein
MSAKWRRPLGLLKRVVAVHAASPPASVILASIQELMSFSFHATAVAEILTGRGNVPSDMAR